MTSGLVAELRGVMWWSHAIPDHPTLGEMSDITTGVRNAIPESDRVTLIGQGKVGYEGNTFGDSAIILRAAPGGTRLRYVAVVLSASSHDQVKAAGFALDDCILQANGLPAKQPPQP